MITHVNGFKLEVTTTDLTPRVRVSLAGGTVVMDTEAVSLTGLEKLSDVFAVAASTARQQLEYAYLRRRSSIGR